MEEEAWIYQRLFLAVVIYSLHLCVFKLLPRQSEVMESWSTRAPELRRDLEMSSPYLTANMM
jgi:hypothetical protein